MKKLLGSAQRGLEWGFVGLVTAGVMSFWVGQAHAVVTFGPGGCGVTVGNSSLIQWLDLSDTFTGYADGGSNSYRVYVPAIQPWQAYVVENVYGHASRSWSNAFSFASDRNPSNPGLVDGSPPFPGNPSVNENVSGSGTITGFTQTGNTVDYGVLYGLRNRFVVQFDAVQPYDRVDITVSNTQGGIADAQGLSVFFRRPTAGLPQIGLYRAGVGETDTGLTSGITGYTWNNYAVYFDRITNRIEIFVNEVSRGVIDLNTFAGGAYKDFSIRAVNLGASPGSGGNRVWTDNAQIGLRQPVLHPDLVAYWNFDESATGTGTAWDQAYANNGTFQGTAARTSGLIGQGAARFNQNATDAINVGNGQSGIDNLFSFTTGITIETLFATNWNGQSEAEFFRKEDGNNRILFSFQRGANINNNYGQLVGTAGVAGISLGLNVGGSYAEMDVALDGLDGRPTLAQVADGRMHHLVATYDAASGSKQMWLDGRLIAMLDLPDNQLITSGGSANAFIGSNGGSTEPFIGILDELAIYRRALSGEEILQHYAKLLQGMDYFWVPEPTGAELALLASLAFGMFLGCQRVRTRRRPAPAERCKRAAASA